MQIAEGRELVKALIKERLKGIKIVNAIQVTESVVDFIDERSELHLRYDVDVMLSPDINKIDIEIKLTEEAPCEKE